MAAQEALVKSSIVKDLLTAIDTLDPQAARRIRSAASADELRRVDEMTRIDRVPMLLYTRLCDAVLAELGPERTRALWHEALAKGLETPMVKVFSGGAVSLAGTSPRDLARLFRPLMDSMHRNMGSIEIEDVGPTDFRVAFRGVPREVLQSAGWKLVQVTLFELLVELSRRQGAVTIAEDAPDRETLSLSVSWRA